MQRFVFQTAWVGLTASRTGRLKPVSKFQTACLRCMRVCRWFGIRSDRPSECGLISDGMEWNSVIQNARPSETAKRFFRRPLTLSNVIRRRSGVTRNFEILGLKYSVLSDWRQSNLRVLHNQLCPQNRPLVGRLSFELKYKRPSEN